MTWYPMVCTYWGVICPHELVVPLPLGHGQIEIVDVAQIAVDDLERVHQEVLSDIMIPLIQQALC